MQFYNIFHIRKYRVKAHATFILSFVLTLMFVRASHTNVARVFPHPAKLELISHLLSYETSHSLVASHMHVLTVFRKTGFVHTTWILFVVSPMPQSWNSMLA